MRERDLERATQLFAEIKKVQECFADHEKIGKFLRIGFELPSANVAEWADAFAALHLNPDALHARTNMLINAMLGEQLTNLKAELRKLGVRLEDDVPPEPKPKGKKQKLLTGPKEEK